MNWRLQDMKPMRLLELYAFGVVIFVMAIVVIDAIAILQYYTLTSLKQKYPKLNDTPLEQYMPLIYRHTNMFKEPKKRETSDNQSSNDFSIQEYNGKYNIVSTNIQFKQSNVKSLHMTADQTMTQATKTYPEKIREGASNLNEGKTHWIALYRVQHLLLRHRILNMNMSSCYTYNNCRFTYIESLRKKTVEADAVIFEGRSIPKILPEHSNENQVYIYAGLMPPLFNHKTVLNERRFRNYFNYTMTYRLDSTIPFPYGSVVLKSVELDTIKKLFETKGYFSESVSPFTYDQSFARKNYSHIFQQKQKGVVWLVNYCKTSSEREQYVKEMRKHTNIDVIGECSSVKLDICSKESRIECVHKLASIYKFYIAFETSLCDGYITENVYRWFSRDIILVVRGARNYNKFLPKGTYIHTEQFSSPKELALYLSKLGSSEIRYTEILQRKDNYKVLDGKKHGQMTFCNLCYRLNNIVRFKNVIRDINHWWSDNICVNASDIYRFKE